MKKPFNWICSCKPYVATYHGRWGPEKLMLVHNVSCTKSRFSRITVTVKLSRELSGRRAVETTDLPQSGSSRRPLSIGRISA